LRNIEQDGDAMAFSYTIKDYDLVFTWTGINMHAPYEELLDIIRVPNMEVFQ
jgi:hypothetical protein